MKFSWNLTNSFLQINKNSILNIKEKLILSGLEIDSIKESNRDIILDLSITTNRKEINCAFNLAREISTLINEKIKIKAIEFPIRKIYSERCNTKKGLRYARVHKIKDLYDVVTPKWISQKLDIHGMSINNNLYDIKEYIRIKWGRTFQIVQSKHLHDLNSILQEENMTCYQKCIQSTINKITLDENTNLLIFLTTQDLQDNDKDKTHDIENFYENYYIETLTIISTITNTRIGKQYESYEYTTLNTNKIGIKKNTINRLLGNIDKKKSKFIETKDILLTLEKIKLSPIYIKRKKSFVVKIPKYRAHDLKREIDIIEEIGKTYEFKHFHNTYIRKTKKGNQTEQSIKIKKIRKVLINLGLSEIISCSITEDKEHYNNNISLQICNPINKTQKGLRDNLLNGLLDNYRYNLKYCNQELSIFEIGKIFNQVTYNEYKEEKYIGGLISNSSYVRKNWIDIPGNFNIFHMKGIIELFTQKINAKINLNYVLSHYNKYKMIKKTNRLGIYDSITNDIIGILGEINDKVITNNQSKEKKIYAFEINLNRLLRTINTKNHLRYIKKIYSKYPSITRDISIKIGKTADIQKVYKQIIDANKNLTESIEVFNEYISGNEDTSNRNRFVGIRIIYRSHTRTLNTNDIYNIDSTLAKLTSQFNKGKT